MGKLTGITCMIERAPMALDEVEIPALTGLARHQATQAAQRVRRLEERASSLAIQARTFVRLAKDERLADRPADRAKALAHGTDLRDMGAGAEQIALDAAMDYVRRYGFTADDWLDAQLAREGQGMDG